jgi:hypothetical protein
MENPNLINNNCISIFNLIYFNFNYILITFKLTQSLINFYCNFNYILTNLKIILTLKKSNHWHVKHWPMLS